MGLGSAVEQVVPGLVRVRTLFANLYLLGDASRWVLVDAGLGGFGAAIRRAAREVLGSARPPEAVVLTHGHFDHVGSLAELVRHWDVPVFVHRAELPFVTGRAKYAPPDPSVGGLMARLSVAYPRTGLRLGERAQLLREDGSVPALTDWRWIATPGHTPGHVSLFRERDRVLVAGDAFVTTRQDSALAVATQRHEIHGPPAYFTPDWTAASASVERLAALRPAVAATGHGAPMRGEPLRRGLADLVARLEDRAMPRAGRHVPARG